VKDNQPALLADLQRAFAPLCDGEPTAPQAAPVAPPLWRQRQEQERGVVLTTVVDAPAKARHGRYERRLLWLLADPAWTTRLGDLGSAATAWPHVQQLYRLERWRICQRTGEISRQVSFGVTSLAPERADAKRVLTAIRAYWAIENRLHYVRDVAMGEDHCQVRSGTAPHAVAACRNLALGLLRRRHCPNVAAALRTCAARPRRAVQLVLSAGRER
jgi:hypothetical protein